MGITVCQRKQNISNQIKLELAQCTWQIIFATCLQAQTSISNEPIQIQWCVDIVYITSFKLG